MDLSEDDVLQILKYLADSSFDELHLEIGDLKIHASKRARTDSLEPGDRETGEANSAEHAAAEITFTLHGGQELHEGQLSNDQEVVEDGLVAIKSPILGTFYQAPKPGEPPFVEIGALVDEETTVCLIEVMKLFTTIKAGRRGRITGIRAQDGQLVEYNEVLFLMDPDIDLEVEPTGASG